MNLRQRIRKDKICCKPWKHYRGEIRLLPVSSQCLFANKGMNWDILEMELKDEGWLLQDENLWEVLSTDSGLKRKLDYGNETSEDPFDDTWTEEDYIYFYANL